jgi:hypothetical protein
VATPPFEGHRTFTWFTPRRRAATEYELYTVGQQSTPDQWLHVGWPIRFDEGREPYTASSTAIRCGNWHDYRYHGWDLADVIEDLGYVRPDGKTLIGQPALDLDRLWTIDDIRAIGFEVKDPLA